MFLPAPRPGRHLCHAMLLARAETLDLLQQLARDGSVDLGAACVNRAGKASIVELRNPGALNALDETTLAPLETAIRRQRTAIMRKGVPAEKVDRECVRLESAERTRLLDPTPNDAA